MLTPHKFVTIFSMDVVQAPDPRLRIQTKPVKKITPGLISTCDQMIKLTKTFKDPEGVGLAATQIGLDEQFFVAKEEGKGSSKFIKVFNPRILSTSKASKLRFEGCLSIPSYYGDVKRFLTVRVAYQNEKGELITQTVRGVLAWIFQHEIDHLNGKLFPDRVLEQKGKFYKYTGKDKAGTDRFEEVTI